MYVHFHEVRLKVFHFYSLVRYLMTMTSKDFYLNTPIFHEVDKFLNFYEVGKILHQNVFYSFLYVNFREVDKVCEFIFQFYEVGQIFVGFAKSSKICLPLNLLILFLINALFTLLSIQKYIQMDILHVQSDYLYQATIFSYKSTGLLWLFRLRNPRYQIAPSVCVQLPHLIYLDVAFLSSCPFINIFYNCKILNQIFVYIYS